MEENDEAKKDKGKSIQNPNIETEETFLKEQILSNLNVQLNQRNECKTIGDHNISEDTIQILDSLVENVSREAPTEQHAPQVAQNVVDNIQNQPGTSRAVPGTSNNSVILIFTQIGNPDASSMEMMSSSNATDSVSAAPQNTNLPDYAAVLKMMKTEKTNAYNVIGPFNRPEVEIILNPQVQQDPPVSGAPPSYSAVLRLGTNETRPNTRRPQIRIQPSPPFVAPLPPPSYAEVHGINNFANREIYPVFEEYVWGPEPLLIFCPRCTTIVQTQTQYIRSNLTHFSALALCLCGCWPCCLLPYCMKSCKNTYHYCPHCQMFLGMYSPW